MNDLVLFSLLSFNQTYGGYAGSVVIILYHTDAIRISVVMFNWC